MLLGFAAVIGARLRGERLHSPVRRNVVPSPKPPGCVDRIEVKGNSGLRKAPFGAISALQ